MGKNHVLRSLGTQEYSCFNDVSSPGFYVDSKCPLVNSAIGMPKGSEFGYLPLSNQSIFRLVTNIKPNDVLSGRGGATNSHSGNRAFRALVKRYQSKYLQAKKRDKPGVASVIVESIRRKGGRFLRRQSSRCGPGIVTWVDIGDARAREKTCQALREGAPEIRKRRKASSSDDGVIVERETVGPNVEYSHIRTNASSDSDRKCCLLSDDTTPADLANDEEDISIMIRPSFELTMHSFVRAISVDQLEPHDRVLYLRDFLPPDPAMLPRAETPASFQCSIGHSDGDLYSCSFVEV